jgi:hypothetical protein
MELKEKGDTYGVMGLGAHGPTGIGNSLVTTDLMKIALYSGTTGDGMMPLASGLNLTFARGRSVTNSSDIKSEL